MIKNNLEIKRETGEDVILSKGTFTIGEITNNSLTLTWSTNEQPPNTHYSAYVIKAYVNGKEQMFYQAPMKYQTWEGSVTFDNLIEGEQYTEVEFGWLKTDGGIVWFKDPTNPKEFFTSSGNVKISNVSFDVDVCSVKVNYLLGLESPSDIYSIEFMADTIDENGNKEIVTIPFAGNLDQTGESFQIWGLEQHKYYSNIKLRVKQDEKYSYPNQSEYDNSFTACKYLVSWEKGSSNLRLKFYTKFNEIKEINVFNDEDDSLLGSSEYVEELLVYFNRSIKIVRIEYTLINGETTYWIFNII